MPLVTFFSVLELPEKNPKGGCNNPPLVRRGLSTWELKKRVKSRLISENTEVETFQSFLVSYVRGGKGKLK